MSGHSKWAKIKRQKGVNDVRRGNLFTKLAKNITLAAKEGGGDISMNFTLRLAVDKAKIANMPSDNIQRAIDKGTGKGSEGTIYHRVTYEALGPGGITVLVDCQTDNTNRTVSEVRNMIETNGGKMASTGSISWQFHEKGLIIVGFTKVLPSKQFGKDTQNIEVDADELEMVLIEIEGIEDLNKVEWLVDDLEVDAFELITTKEDFSKVLKEIERMNYKILSAELVKIANEKIEVEDEKVLEKINYFVQNLEEHDDVDAVWLNC